MAEVQLLALVTSAPWECFHGCLVALVAYSYAVDGVRLLDLALIKLLGEKGERQIREVANVQ